MQPQIITVKHLLNKFRKDIDKQLEYLTNMAKRLKLAAPTWTMSEVYEYEFEIVTLLGGGRNPIDDVMEYDYDTEVFIEPVFDITLNVEDAMKIDGDWVFGAAVDHRNKSMLQIDPELVIPSKYTPSNDTCEHCGKRYPRVKSFVVFNRNTNEFKQVGKGCLKQFLGINPASYITMFEAVSKFSNTVEGYGRKNTGGRMDNLAYNVSEMLRYVIHQVGKDGRFVKTEWKQVEVGTDWRGKPNYRNVIANPETATVCKIRERLEAVSFFRLNPALRNDATQISELEPIVKRNEKRIALFEGADMKRGETSFRWNEIKRRLYDVNTHIRALMFKNLLDEVILPYDEEVAAVKAFVEGLEIPVVEDGTPLMGFDQYKQKLKTVFLKDRTLQSNLSTIVSGYGFYLNQKKKAEERANAKPSEYVGVVGEKSELQLKVTDRKTGEGNFGTWELWTLEDEAGNKFKKFGKLSVNHIIKRGDQVQDKNEETVREGDTLHVMAEIKKHETYRDDKQTMLGKMSKVKKVKYLFGSKKKETINE